MNLFQRYLVEEFAEDYQEGLLTRRQALKLIASVTGSMVAATTILAACTPPAGESPTLIPTTGPTAQDLPAADTQAAPAAARTATVDMPASAPTAGMTAGAETPEASTATGTPPPSGTVSPDDPAVQASPVEFPGADGAALAGYLARPAGQGPFAVVLVCHENRGLTSHIEDVTRRLAKAGYVALAVDLLSRHGGTAAVGSENVPGVLGNIEPDQFVADFRSGWQYLQGQEGADTQRVGMVGFCFGGGVTWRCATKFPELLAAVPFYGPHPPLEDVPGIQAAVLAIYAERDQRINQGIPAIEEAMTQNNKTFEKEIYPNADHVFHNDTSPRYNPEAARAAWARTLEWFARYLT